MKRLAAAIAAIALAAALIFPAAAADENVVFTAVNDRLLAFDPASMPFESEGVMYVAAFVFDDSELRTYISTERGGAELTVYSSEKYLRFDLENGGSSDSDGLPHAFSALRRGAFVYVPALGVSEFFGFTCSVLSGAAAPVLRIVSRTGMSADSFIRAASIRIQSTLNEYLASLPTPAVTPTASQAETSVGINIFGISSSTPRMLMNMAVNGFRACFFLTARDIRENPDTVRRILGMGGSIGFICSENLEQDYAEASALLREASKARTCLVSLSCEETPALKSEAERLGIVLCFADGDLNSSFCPDADDLKTLLERSSGRAELCFGCSDSSLESFWETLKYLVENNFAVRPLSEVTAGFGESVYG